MSIKNSNLRKVNLIKVKETNLIKLSTIKVEIIIGMEKKTQ